MAAFILTLNLVPNGSWPTYLLLLSLTISLALVFGVSISSLLLKSLWSLPFILAALPLVFTGSAAIKVELWQDFRLPFNPEGLRVFISIAIRSWLSVQAAVLLALTTQAQELLTGLQRLRLPAALVTIIGLMLRYLGVIRDEGIRMLRARASRSAALPGQGKGGGTLFWRARVSGGMAGNLFLRSIERSERVYAAMLCRGYTGSISALQKAPLRQSDRLLLFFGILLLACLAALGMLFGGGR